MAKGCSAGRPCADHDAWTGGVEPPLFIVVANGSGENRQTAPSLFNHINTAAFLLVFSGIVLKHNLFL